MRAGRERRYNYGGERRPEEWRAILTTGNLFEVLGVPLARGHGWPTEADRVRDVRVIQTDGVWRRAFAAQEVVGHKISLDHAASPALRRSSGDVSLTMPGRVPGHESRGTTWV